MTVGSSCSHVNLLALCVLVRSVGHSDKSLEKLFSLRKCFKGAVAISGAITIMKYLPDDGESQLLGNEFALY